ncbi:hypothetical protein MCNS_16070 [Mycobacterium conspicuum]|uniref:DUF2277 domain-containing protein n=2 Tax=Mycobacterium conspicuum TaxID=44010 RepID=A0A7I7YB84_9MYCO|nr:hypothetical protein MCNS_16070 [Mycobacterium conspicuum]
MAFTVETAAEQGARGRPIVVTMCCNITELRGLQPAATAEEIAAAARQYVRKVSGITHPSAANEEAFEAAVAEVTATTTRLLGSLPPRRQPPKTVPPLRRLAAG